MKPLQNFLFATAIALFSISNMHASELYKARAEHAMIGTQDYSGTLKWYQDILGFRIKHEWIVPEFPDLKLAYLEKSGFILEIVASSDTVTLAPGEDFLSRLKQPGYGHLAFIVDDVDAVATELTQKEVIFVVPPTSFPDSGRRLIFIEDNNGNLIEFLEELPLTERRPYTGGEPLDDEAIIRRGTERWAKLWDIGTGAFDAEGFREVFAPGENGIEVFDNVMSDVIVIRSIDDYVEIWRPFMEPLPVWSVDTELRSIQISGDLAFTTFRIVGTDTQGPDGEDFPFGQYGTHIWKKFPKLGWRIIHEHLTVFDITKAQ